MYVFLAKFLSFTLSSFKTALSSMPGIKVYEAEEAARRKELDAERERLNREREENEAKVAADIALLNQRRLDEQAKLQA